MAHPDSDNHVHWLGRRIEGVVFDLDGTLTDSIDIFFDLFQSTAAETGIRVDRTEIFEPLAEGRDIWAGIVGRHDGIDRDTIKKLRKRLLPRFQSALPRVRPLPGVGELLSRLRDRGVKLGVFTDSNVAALQTLQEHSLDGYFDGLVTIDDGFPRKPEAAGLVDCLRQMRTNPTNAVIVGDTIMDVRAGKEVDALTVGVLTGLAGRSQLEAAEPSAIIVDVTQMADLLNVG